ncbi:MAG: PfkB family carbohydrate kinase [Pseudomonadota bacterium]
MKVEEQRILCVGACHWDLIGRTRVRLSVGDDVAGRIERRPGGVALNVARGLVGHGQTVSLCSTVGDDAAGLALIQENETFGIDCTYVFRVKETKTDHYMAIEDDRGDLFAAIADVAALEENSDAIVRQAEVALPSVHSVFLEANLSEPTLQRIADAAKRTGAEIVANPVSPSKSNRLRFFLSGEHTPILVTNLAEANAILESDFDTSRTAAKALSAQTCGMALVTNRAEHATLATPSDVMSVLPPELQEDLSVTGAGDALLSGFLAARARGYGPDAALKFALSAAANHMKDSKKP